MTFRNWLYQTLEIEYTSEPNKILFSYSYLKAIELHEEMARHSVKNIILSAGLRRLCRGDAVAITDTLEKYQVYWCCIVWRLLGIHLLLQDLDPTFPRTREYRFLAVSIYHCERTICAINLWVLNMQSSLCLHGFLSLQFFFSLLYHCFLSWYIIIEGFGV